LGPPNDPGAAHPRRPSSSHQGLQHDARPGHHGLRRGRDREKAPTCGTLPQRLARASAPHTHSSRPQRPHPGALTLPGIANSAYLTRSRLSTTTSSLPTFRNEGRATLTPCMPARQLERCHDHVVAGCPMHLFAMVTWAVLVLGLGGTARADKCTRAKLTDLARKEARLLACHEKAAAKGDATLLGPCLAKIETRYVAAFANAGTCDGEQTTCACLADKCATAVRVALPERGPSTCEAARLKAAARRASAKLLCNARAVRAGIPVSAACLRKAEARYQASFKATGCSGDQA